jgi:hypothetical protein
LKSANYNTLNYGTSEAVTIGLTLAYDNAIQSPLTAGVGTSVGRAFSGSTGIATGIGTQGQQ